MSLFVKICGLTTPAAVAACIEAGADAAGFVFSPSPRELSPARARALASAMPASMRRVAVFRRPPPGWIASVLAAFPADWVQCDAVDLPGVDLGGAETLPVFRVGGPLPALLPDLLLFEGADSGTGQVADWDSAAALARRTRLVLAGGLQVDNLAEALARVRPWGVDVSSGVESSPGVKDPLRIATFVATARRLAKAHEAGR
jgi:phosphoribosylanthranilate isomerase